MQDIIQQWCSIDWGALGAFVSVAVAAWAAWSARSAAKASLKTAGTANKIAVHQQRLRIYDSVFDFLGGAIQAAPPSQREIHRLAVETRNARFLFDEKISEFLKDVLRAANEWQEEQEQSDAGRLPLRGVQRAQSIKDAKKSLVGYLDQVPDLFAPYLMLEEAQ